ncbi:hypothetical protein BGZ73_003013 [Actinomortierella ambigua]|nr:hypothetical protein BGZ73_003013 [Actinomortierella ambigua]
MAGFWIIVIFFEFIQCKRVPRKLAHGAGWDAHGASQAQPDQITVKPNTMANTQHAESDRPPETAYDPNYAQQQGYTPSPHLQPHTAYPPTPDASIVAGPKTELSGTLNTGDKMNFNVIGFPNTDNGSFGVKIGTTVTKLSALDTFPLWNGTVADATETVEYKYVKLDDAGTVIEEEPFLRRLTQPKAIKAKTTPNEFFQRNTTFWTLPNVPQVYEGELPSNSNALEAEDQIATIHVTCDPAYIDSILKTPSSDEAHNPAPVDFRYINAEKFLSVKNISMKISGKSSMDFNKQAFKFEFEDSKNQSFFHRQHIKLRSETQDPTMMREKVYIDVLNAIGVPTQQGVWVRFYANKKPIGLYLMVDDISKSFLRQTVHHGDKSVVTGSLIQMNAPKVDQQASLTYLGPLTTNYPKYVYTMVNLGNNPPTDPYHQLIELMEVLKGFDPVTTPDPIAFWQDKIDLDGFLRNMAMEYLGGSWDAYWHSGSNYFLYYNPTLNGTLSSSGANSKRAAPVPPGRWQWISTDFDGTFGNGDPTDSLTTYEAWATDFGQFDRPMVTKLILKCQPIRARFDQMLREIVGWCFKPEGLFPRIGVYEQMLAPEVAWDIAIDRTGNPGKNNQFTIEDFHNSIKGPVDRIRIGIKPWIEGRTKDLQAQLAFQVQPGTPDRVPRPVRHKKKLDGTDDSQADVVSNDAHRPVSSLWIPTMLTLAAAYLLRLLVI